MTQFGRLNPDGTVTHIKTIKQSSMMKCPFFIMVPEHYRDDESCRCDDPTHREMSEWGYRWDPEAEKWVGGEEGDEGTGD